MCGSFGFILFPDLFSLFPVKLDGGKFLNQIVRDFLLTIQPYPLTLFFYSSPDYIFYSYVRLVGL